MELYLARPDLFYFEQYKEMVKEWAESEGGIESGLWFMPLPAETLEQFAKLIGVLHLCETAVFQKTAVPGETFFLLDENERLIGGACLCSYLTPESIRFYGHIEYGLRPSERQKGYAVKVLQLLLAEARMKKMSRVLISVRESNIASWKTVEKCGGVLEEIVQDEKLNEMVRRYWVSTFRNANIDYSKDREAYV